MKKFFKNRLNWFLIFIVILIFILFFKISDLKSRIWYLEYMSEYQRIIFVSASYYWDRDISNNVDWIWERSLSLPEEAKWKTCFILWSKISWVGWWAIRGFLWKNRDSVGGRYYYQETYEANINFLEQKIEIIKNNWYSDQNLTEDERKNLYFEIALLCK